MLVFFAGFKSTTTMSSYLHKKAAGIIDISNNDVDKGNTYVSKGQVNSKPRGRHSNPVELTQISGHKKTQSTQIEGNEQARSCEMNGNDPHRASRTGDRSHQDGTTEVNGNEQRLATKIDEEKPQSGEVNGNRLVRPAETNASNPILLITEIPTNNHSQQPEINGLNFAAPEYVSCKSSDNELSESKLSSKDNGNCTWREKGTCSQQPTDTYASAPVHGNTVTCRQIRPLPPGARSTATPRARRELFPPCSASRIVGETSSPKRASPENGCSDAKKTRLTSVVVVLSHERNSPRLGESNVNQNLRGNVRNGINVNLKRGRSLRGEQAASDGTSSARTEPMETDSSGERVDRHNRSETPAGDSTDHQACANEMDTNETADDHHDGSDRNAYEALRQQKNRCSIRTESEDSLSPLRQTCKRIAPDLTTLTLFEKLPSSSPANYLPFWRNLHLDDLELDYILRNFYTDGELLEKTGSHVQTLTVRSSIWQTDQRVEQFVKLVPFYCSNITALTVDFPQLHESAVASIAQTNNLQIVRVRSLFVRNLKSLITCLMPLQELRELNIRLNDEVEIDLEQQHLGELIVAMNELFGKNRLLQTVKFTFAVSSEMVRSVLERCPSLEHLELNVQRAKRYLHHSAFDIRHPNLKTLVIRSKVRFMTDTWLATFISSFPNLRRLELWGVQGNVSSYLVEECVRKFETKFV